ncbi:MAG TPA: hypothetical protein VIG92_03945 [Rhodospirillales bacterium]
MSRFAPACSRGRPVVKATWLILAALQFAGCAQTAPVPPTSSSVVAGQAAGKAPSQSGKTVPSSFNDLPIPQGAKLNVDKTLVVGTQTWYGQLMLETSHSADSMYDFYSRELANFGWRRIAAVRAPTSILTYDRENRVLAIAIQPARVYGSEITITVSPREEATPPGGPAIGPGGGEPIGGPIMPPPVRQVR